MKVRNGFVSNSSSCSFTCPKCHNTFDGWDWDKHAECSECGTDVLDYEGMSFEEHLCAKYNLDYEKERDDFLKRPETVDDKLKKVFGGKYED